MTSSTTPGMGDASAAPSTTYTYAVRAVDYHMNAGPLATFSVTTPAIGAYESTDIPRGVRSTGGYWGASGEQIDVVNGNLSFSLPLLTAQGRGGTAVPFHLSYNSQNWRQDSGGNWKSGRDVGYGFGWQLMAGSVRPYYQDAWTLHHFLYTDSTGAEYRLDVNTNGVWTSREGTYAGLRREHTAALLPGWQFLGDGLRFREPGAGRRHAVSDHPARHQRTALGTQALSLSKGDQIPLVFC